MKSTTDLQKAIFSKKTEHLMAALPLVIQPQATYWLLHRLRGTHQTERSTQANCGRGIAVPFAPYTHDLGSYVRVS